MRTFLNRFVRDEAGATAIEYVLIGALIALGLVVGLEAVGGNVGTQYNALQNKVSSTPSVP